MTAAGAEGWPGAVSSQPASEVHVDCSQRESCHIAHDTGSSSCMAQRSTSEEKPDETEFIGLSLHETMWNVCEVLRNLKL